jgi:hypothetical protein
MQGSAQQALAGLALALGCLLGIYVGVRTLLVWRRTGEFPELSIGINILSISVGGCLFATFIAVPNLKDSAYAQWFYAAMVVALALHPMALASGTWRIFRPDDQWPMAVCIMTTLFMAGYISLWYLFGIEMASRSLLYEGPRLVLFIWTAFECFRCRDLLMRRARIGLADPLIAHRIGLWGIASVAQVISSAILITNVIGDHTSALLPTSVALYAVTGLGLLATVCIALTFFPPRAYVRWMEALYASESA